MQFADAAPGHLVFEGGVYVGKWALGSISVISDSAARDWVSSALNDSRGWGRAGITFEEVALGDARVAFSVVETIAGSPGTIGIGNTSATGLRGIAIEAGQYAAADLVNHEAAHSFFAASHSPEGSDSMMEPLEEAGDEWPSDTDIAQVRAWLGVDTGVPEPPKALPEATYWHPLDLGHYISWRDFSGKSEVLLTVPVPRMREVGLEPGNILKAVCADDLSNMDPESWDALGASIEFGSPGFYDSGWQPLEASGTKYVGMTIKTSMPIDELSLGQAEIRTR